MKAMLTHPSWAQVEKGCARIVNQMMKSNFNPDYIVGLTRGGLIPAVVISQMLDVPMIAVNYSSKQGKGDNRNHTNTLPNIYGNVYTSGNGQLPAMPSLLVIDDICDSGYTLKEVYDYYTAQNNTVMTATLYFKEQLSSEQIFTPDYYWQKITSGDPWVEFPWEL